MKKSKYIISICGHFGGNKNFWDGQTVKTKNIYNSLLDTYSDGKINIVDTYKWKKHPVKFLCKCISSVKNSKNIIMLPARNGVKVFTPLYVFINKFYRRKLFYIVIGGWLPSLLKERKFLIKQIRKIDQIFVETHKMKKDLADLGITNVEILLNFKNITPIEEKKLEFNFTKPYKLCTFSRVMKEKGIEDAINIIKRINEESGSEIYNLDIYGPIDKAYEIEFNEKINKFPDYIRYKGYIDSDKSVEVLKDYYLLLFPTKFNTEGIPGTIIDALFAGVPIIASSWENVDEIIKNNENGIIFEINNINDFYKKMKLEIDEEKIKNMKYNCLKIAKNYTKENVITKLYSYIEE